jgi:hypothetical protein
MRTLKEVDQMIVELSGDLVAHRNAHKETIKRLNERIDLNSTQRTEVRENTENDIDTITVVLNRLEFCCMDLTFIGDYEI